MADRAVDLGLVRSTLEEQGTPWISGDTSMSRMTEPQRVRRLGVPLPDDHGDIVARGKQVHARAAAKAAAAGAPASFDARSVGGASYVTPIKDQGDCGSCVAFGSCATIETTAAFTRGQPGLGLDLSEAHLFYTLGGAAGVTCDTGWMPAPALDACQSIGVTFEDQFPYTPRNSGGATLSADWANHLAKVTAHQDVTGDPAAIKSWIAAHGAVAACLVVYQDFFSYRTGIYRHVAGNAAGGHCVSLVGYDDGAGCWIAKNSWSAGWGDGGFVRIGYGECGIETWAVQGVAGVGLRHWMNGAHVVGLWSSQDAANAWAYVEDIGWLRLAPSSDQANLTMLLEATSARLGNRPVNAFDDDGALTQLYVL